MSWHQMQRWNSYQLLALPTLHNDYNLANCYGNEIQKENPVCFFHYQHCLQGMLPTGNITFC